MHQADDLHPPPLVAVQDGQNLGGAVPGADNQDVSIVVTLLAEQAQKIADQELFGQQEEKGEDEEGSKEASAKPLGLNEKYDGGSEHPTDGGDRGQGFQDGPGCAHALRVVVAVALQKYEPDRNDDDEQPGIRVEMPEPSELHPQVECQQKGCYDKCCIENYMSSF